jgi:high-affinity iron transporter|tara:strand:- start:3748 stop:4656 length:909 start_codon:yes stop_codon:yes gene_type:complete
MNEFIIVFRESLEACLIIGIIYLLLEKNNLKKELKQLWLGVFSAIVASIVVAISLNYVKDSIGNESISALFEGLSMYITAGLLWYVIFWLSKHVSHRDGMEKKADQAIAASGWGIFLLVFFAILREGFETALFLMGSFSMTGSFSYIGFFGGLILALFIGYGIVIQGRKINLRLFFQGTTLMLAIFASGMVAFGTHEVEEFVVKGNHLELVGYQDEKQIPRVWDILKPTSELKEGSNPIFYSYNLNNKNMYTHILHDKGRVGVFLKGFIGYNSNPNWPEVLLWLLSLIFGITMWRRFYFKKI